MISLFISITVTEHKPWHDGSVRPRSFNKTDTAPIPVIRIGTCHAITGWIRQDSGIVTGMDVGHLAWLGLDPSHDHRPFRGGINPELTSFRRNRRLGERNFMRRNLQPVPVKIHRTAENAALRDSASGKFNRSASVKR